MKCARRLLVGLVSLTLLGGLGACGDRSPAQPAQVNLTITGMHCENCAETITRRLRHTRGIHASNVHFTNAVQQVDYDAARLEATQIISAITNLGFSAQLAEAPPGGISSP